MTLGGRIHTQKQPICCRIISPGNAETRMRSQLEQDSELLKVFKVNLVKPAYENTEMQNMVLKTLLYVFLMGQLFGISLQL